MRRVFLVVASLAVRGQSLITLDIGSGAAQWNGSGRNLSSYRIEFRLENVQPSTTVLSNGGGVGWTKLMTVGGYAPGRGFDTREPRRVGRPLSTEISAVS